MAFNPFEAFSMRSRLGRSLMAVLGIVVMLTFVLSSGAVGTGNDFFDQIGGIFNSKKKGDVVATAYGDKVHHADLTEVRRQRLAARSFLLHAREASYINWTTELGEMAKGTQLTLPVREFVSAFAAARPNRNANATDNRKYQVAADFTRLQTLLREAKPESDDRRALSGMANIIAHDQMGAGLTPVLPDPEFNPETDDGDLNFLLLLKKADQLGVKYSDKAIVDLVARETGGRLTKEDNGAIEADLRKSQQFGAFSGEWLLQAVGNEFRARTALAALQGQSLIQEYIRSQARSMVRAMGADSQAVSTATALPGGVTPYEFFEFYKDQCSEHTFSTIEVPASAFVSKVTGEPTNKERVELFTKYRGELPDPTSDRPGFKDPRKVAVSFATLDATAKRITDAQPKVAAANLFLALSAGAMTPGGAVPGLLQAVHPELAATMPIRDAVRNRLEQNRRPYNLGDQFLFSPRDTSIYRPEPIAALIAGFAGYPSISATSVPYVLATRYMELEELRHRIPFDLQAWLMPFNPVPTNAFGFPAYALPHLAKLPPEGLYTAMVLADQKKRDRRQLFEADVEQFERKLGEIARDLSPFGAMLGGKKDDKETKEKAAKAKVEARKYVAEWLAERGLAAHGSSTPQSAMDLSKDPALKTLNDLAFPEPDGTNSFTEKVFANINFGQQLGRQMPDFPQMSAFQTDWFPRKPEGDDLDKPSHLFWLTADVPAIQYSSLKAANEALAKESLGSFNGLLFRFNPKQMDRMTERVDRAWRLEKARALAKAEADKLAEKVKEIGKRAAANPVGVEKEMRDLVAAQNFRVITLDGMAKLKFDHLATQAQLTYGPPKIDKTKVMYPSSDFADKLLDVRNEPLGAVTVVADAPRTHYYVACLVASTPKTVEQFRDVFLRTNAFGPAENPLYARHALALEQMEASRNIVARLRAEAGVPMDALKKEEGSAE